MKRILIIHYHLNPGGVTRIVESQVRALRKADPLLEILVLTAFCENPVIIENAGARIIYENRLNYLHENKNFNKEYQALRKFFSDILREGDLLHIHNLNLGKNPVLTLVISELIMKGYPVVNHAHDFAEDRPANYEFLKRIIQKITGKPVSEVLYPDRKNLVYIVLNSADRKKLIDFGVNEEQTFVVPNPVVFSSKHDNDNRSVIRSAIVKKLQLDGSKKLVTYPVRVIRRKNIGEYILLVFLFKDVANWVVTQPPRNPVEVRPYLEWKKFCDKKKIPVFFEAGNLVDFESLMLSSDFCFTTSTKEGFGMVYMEPWLFDVTVIGRDLTNITPDLKEAGIVFPLLYPSININWNNSVVDFASLSTINQMQYISNLVETPGKAGELFSQNEFLRKLLNSVDQTLIEKNKAIILQEFSLENYAKRLERIYQKIAR